MKKEGMETIKERAKPKRRYDGLIAAAVGIALAALLAFVLLGVPILRAHRLFRAKLEVLRDEKLEYLLLNDPLVEGELVNTSKEVYLDGEEASELVADFLGAFDSFQYVRNETYTGGLMYPFFMVVTEDGAAQIYLQEDAVWVEKNSAFYRFIPRSAEGAAAYAEWYEAVLLRLSEA